MKRFLFGMLTMVLVMGIFIVGIVLAEDEDQGSVVFGEGQRGATLPTGAESPRPVYRSGLGAKGNIPAGAEEAPSEEDEDSGKWLSIAEPNKIGNPRTLEPGEAIVFPPLPLK